MERGSEHKNRELTNVVDWEEEEVEIEEEAEAEAEDA
jgi:hypothetical protein